MRNSQAGKFRECDWCHQGIGIEVYKSGAVSGEYCCSEHYVQAVIFSRGWKVELEPEEETI